MAAGASEVLTAEGEAIMAGAGGITAGDMALTIRLRIAFALLAVLLSTMSSMAWSEFFRQTRFSSAREGCRLSSKLSP